MDDLIAKFAPPRLHTDPRFHAVLACLLGGHRWTTPHCVRIIISPDNHFVSVRPDGGADDFGPVSDFRRNLRKLIETMALTETEKHRIATLINRNIEVQGGRFDAFEILDLTPPDPRMN